MNEYLYLLSNPSMPDLVKIGMTRNEPDERLQQLFSTGVPQPFVLEFCAIVNDGLQAERLAHDGLSSYRLSSSREFFRIDVIKAIEITKLAIGPHLVHTDRHETVLITEAKEALQRARQRIESEMRAEKKYAQDVVEREANKAKLRSEIRAIRVQLNDSAVRVGNLEKGLASLKTNLRRLGLKPAPEKQSFWSSGLGGEYKKMFESFVRPWVELEQKIMATQQELEQQQRLHSSLEEKSLRRLAQLESELRSSNSFKMN